MWKQIENWIKKLLNDYAKASTPKPLPLPLPVPDSPATGAAEGCSCDLSLPLVDPPWTGSQLAAMGNRSECPLWQGKDIRLQCRYASHNKVWLLGQLLGDAMGQRDGKLFGKCFVRDGYAYHFRGYSHNRDGLDPVTPAKAGDLFPYVTTTFVHYECRKAQ
jgi:hypothetical protein